jgi:hypothetical protein
VVPSATEKMCIAEAPLLTVLLISGKVIEATVNPTSRSVGSVKGLQAGGKHI